MKTKPRKEIKSYAETILATRLDEQSVLLPQLPRNQFEEEEKGGLELDKLFAAARRKMPLIVGLTILTASTAAVQALISTPTYTSKFELLINPVTIEDKLSTSPLNNEKENKEAEVVGETELKILQSPKLIAPINEQIEAQYPDSQLLKHLNFKLIPKTNIVEVNYQDPNSEKVKLVLDLLSKAYLVYSLEERRADVRNGIQFVEEQLPKLRKQVATLQDEIQKFRQQKGLIDPESQGKQLGDQLSAIVQQQQDAQTQLAKTRALYSSLKKQLQLQSNEATAATALSEAPRYQSLLEQLQEIQAKIAVETARYREDNPTIQNLRAQETNLLSLVEKERQSLVGKNLVSTTVKPAALASPNSLRQQQIQDFFDAAKQIQALEAQIKALTKAESLLRQQVRQFPSVVRQNDDLQRQLNISVENLNQFLTKREALRIDLAQKQVPWQLLTPPTDPEATVASVKLNLILGTALGLLLGVGVAVLLDKFNNVLYTLEEVEDTTGLQVLGEIPVVAGITDSTEWVNYISQPGHVGKPSQQQNISRFWESLRSLYTNISFLSFNTSVRSLAVISAAAADGRSTIALHLAQTAAVMGQRVLLVDANLRDPKVHQMLDLDNTQGLSNVIATDLDFEKVIHRVNSITMKAQVDASSELLPSIESPSDDVFFVLTAGSIPPNPTNLLSSQKMQNLVSQLEATFDLVIYDTSPLVGLADSSLVAARADASVLVVGLDKTRRSVLEKALAGLKISAIPVLGVVANGVKA